MSSLKGKNVVKLKHKLPALKVKNAKTARDNGAAMTDVIVTWVKKGYIA